MVDHRSHADRGSARDHEFGRAVLALVDEVFFAGDAGAAVRDAGHHAQGLVDDGPEEGFALELDPGEGGWGDVGEVGEEAGLEGGVGEEVVGDDG